MAVTSALENKLDDKFDQLVKLSQETLAEMKKMSGLQEVRLDHYDKYLDQLRAADEKASEARKEIYERLDKIEQKCAAYHGLNGCGTHTASSAQRDRRATDHPGNFIEAWIGKKFYMALSIILGAMLGAVGIEILKALLRR